MGNLSNLLSSMSILNEADDLFDIDKEVDAQIKRVTKRIERKQQESQATSPEDQQDAEIDNSSEEENVSDTDEQPIEQDSDVGSTDDIGGEEPPQESDDQQDSGEYEYMDNGQQEDIPEDYEPKQTIPELKILSTLSDSEYALCNIKIMEQFRELQNNVESTINNILINIMRLVD